MAVLIVILTLALLVAVVLLVTSPLRGRAHASLQDPHEDGAVGASADEASDPSDAARALGSLEREELEAAREAKYREIRDCELDFRTGKLSCEDYEAIDAQLRAEAIEILDRLERAPLGPEGGT